MSRRKTRSQADRFEPIPSPPSPIPGLHFDLSDEPLVDVPRKRSERPPLTDPDRPSKRRRSEKSGRKRTAPERSTEEEPPAKEARTEANAQPRTPN